LALRKWDNIHENPKEYQNIRINDKHVSKTSHNKNIRFYHDECIVEGIQH
jgi:hypothetical protein